MLPRFSKNAAILRSAAKSRRPFTVYRLIFYFPTFSTCLMPFRSVKPPGRRGLRPPPPYHLTIPHGRSSRRYYCVTRGPYESPPNFLDFGTRVIVCKNSVTRADRTANRLCSTFFAEHVRPRRLYTYAVRTCPTSHWRNNPRASPSKINLYFSIPVSTCTD